MSKVGVYIIGARGNVSTTAIVGAIAISNGQHGPTGMVTAGPEFKGLGLPALQDMVFGGCDVSEKSLADKGIELAHANILPFHAAADNADALKAIDKNIDLVRGFEFGAVPEGGYLAELTRMEERLARFRS
ncbi:MAG: inositol-3-phosphate synthase, partial [Planctomycetota bacterium]